MAMKSGAYQSMKHIPRAAAPTKALSMMSTGIKWNNPGASGNVKMLTVEEI